MLRKCTCGGNKVVTESTEEMTAQFPGASQYAWFCDSCDKHGIGWSFGPKPHPVLIADTEYFETQEEALEDYRSW